MKTALKFGVLPSALLIVAPALGMKTEDPELEPGPGSKFKTSLGSLGLARYCYKGRREKERETEKRGEAGKGNSSVIGLEFGYATHWSWVFLGWFW